MSFQTTSSEKNVPKPYGFSHSAALKVGRIIFMLREAGYSVSVKCRFVISKKIQ